MTDLLNRNRIESLIDCHHIKKIELQKVGSRNTATYIEMLLTTLSLLLFRGVTDTYANETCKYPTSTVETFTASLYTALIVTSDQNYVNSLELSGLEAARLEYDVVYRVLTDFGSTTPQDSRSTPAWPSP
ncbi:hypothetical protein JTE90_025119 [Oedothorax gibbosus]|uniref:Uncharacterized protein n=1 Tax=Oedothorax gibbosus TaxID=931172 RepID=A0AAV6U194_9ARAC|nr:hypothetical protein JTE90_025119 [Oedothorax gibbosus]